MTTAEPMAWPRALEDRRAKREPFGWYRQMHESGGIRYDTERNCWDVFAHDAVTAVLADAETYSSVTAPADDRGGLPSMLSADPPEHTELREPVEEFFQPGTVRTLVPEIRDTTETLLDEADGAGADAGDRDRLDVVDDLAWPLPIHTIAALLGVPAEDREQFKAWSDAVVAGPQLTDGDRDELAAERRNAALSLADYFAEVSARRRADPRDDLVSRVLVETDLSDLEVLGLFRLLLIAGNVTTTNLITNTLWCLDDAGLVDVVRGDGRGGGPIERAGGDADERAGGDADERAGGDADERAGGDADERAGGHADRLDDAIEETLRYRSPVQRTVRRATRETELLGHRVEADDRLAVWLGAANRDPDRFDAPDTFDLDRSPNPHVAFGRGVHVCLGAPLARLEARIALEALLSRYATIERVDADPDPVASPFIYGVQAFPVAVEGRA